MSLEISDKIVRREVGRVFSAVNHKAEGRYRVREKLNFHSVMMKNIKHLRFRGFVVNYLVIHIQDKLNQLVYIVKTPVIILIMQLFREHEIPVPLKTQGWIINSLHSIRYDPQIGEWNYRYFKGSRNSTKMFDLLSKLSAAIQTRQQFEEHGASPPDSPVLDCEEEQDMEL